ncbi:MAG: phosphomannomutase/phosphoglucomutase [Phycisphaerae bacterium]
MFNKLFKAYDVRSTYPDPLNEEAAWKIGYAAATFLSKSIPPQSAGDPEYRRIVVGRDMRPSSPSLSSSLIDGIRAAGVSVVDIGMIDTSMIYFAVNEVKCCGGIQTTASHNPAHYNGFKISGMKAKPIGESTGLKDIRAICEGLTTRPAPGTPGDLIKIDLTDGYRKHVLKFLNLKRTLHVAIDGSNGMAGKFIPEIFAGAPGLKISSINMEITGSFVHEPNPLVDANLRQLQELVLSAGADLGVCFDGDADRCIFVDEQGRIIRCDIVTALLASHFLRNNPGAAVVYDLRSSRTVKEEIENASGIAVRERVGHAFMKKTLAERQGVFGGELSGHFYFRDNFNCDSGAIAFACMLSVLSGRDEPVSQVLKPLLRWHDSGEINFEVADKDGTISRLAERYADAQIDYLDGITVQYDTWWFNARKSNTEPLLRLNLEAGTQELLRKKLDELSRQIGKPVSH